METTATAKLRLGDKVTAIYGTETLAGTVDGFDMSGWVYITGTTRGDVGIRPSDRAGVKLVARGPELTWDDVVEMPDGAQWLRKRQEVA